MPKIQSSWPNKLGHERTYIGVEKKKRQEQEA